MKKKVKKLLSRLMPDGKLKDRVKLAYYNFNSGPQTDFRISGDKANLYHTKYNNLEFTTIHPLYNIVADFDYYQHFYKVKKGDTVIDAGANHGYLSLLFSKLAGSGGKIFAFEPDSINIAVIKQNQNLNKGSENILIEDSLLWNENTMLDFCEAGTVGSSAIWMPDKEKIVKKKAVTIDSWTSEKHLDKIDFIKMDIEGAELEAIEGCKNVIKKYSPNFAIASYHIVNGQPTYLKLEEMFREMNYPYKTVIFRKTEIITFAGKNVK